MSANIQPPRAKPANRGGLIAAIVAVVVVVVIGAVLVGRRADDSAQANIAAQDLQADFAAIEAAGPNGNPAIDPKPKAQGQMGVLEGALKGLIVQVLTDRREYIAELKDAGLEKLLSADSLAA